METYILGLTYDEPWMIKEVMECRLRKVSYFRVRTTAGAAILNIDKLKGLPALIRFRMHKSPKLMPIDCKDVRLRLPGWT